jgi:hypothetical protein
VLTERVNEINAKDVRLASQTGELIKLREDLAVFEKIMEVHRDRKTVDGLVHQVVKAAFMARAGAMADFDRERHVPGVELAGILVRPTTAEYEAVKTTLHRIGLIGWPVAETRIARASAAAEAAE